MEDSGDASWSVIFADSCFRCQKGCNQHSRNMNVYYCYSDIRVRRVVRRSQVASRPGRWLLFATLRSQIRTSQHPSTAGGR